jgi:parallel beta-helix repeat protein
MLERRRLLICLITLTVLFVSSGQLLGANPIQSSWNTNLAVDSSTPAYTPHIDIDLVGDAALLAYAESEEWDGDGSEEDPFIISGYEFTTAGHAIRLEDTTLHWEFRDNRCIGTAGLWCVVAILNSCNGKVINNTISWGAVGVHIAGGGNFTIRNNTVYDSSVSGIIIEDGSDFEIDDNEVYGCPSGVYVGNPTDQAMASDSVITNNYLHENLGDGIMLEDCTRITVSGNVIEDNADSGIRINRDSNIIRDNIIQFNDYGLSINGDHNVVEDCTISNNTMRGIRLNGASFNNISDCDISGNNQHGVWIYSSNNNSIVNCMFGNNGGYGVDIYSDSMGNVVEWSEFDQNGEGCQVCDDGTENLFQFNYYSEWTTPDEDIDGIVDNPYVIDGDALNSDLYPRISSCDACIRPTTTTSTSTTATTTTTTTDPPMLPIMELAVLSGAAVLVIIVVILAKKRDV